MIDDLVSIGLPFQLGPSSVDFREQDKSPIGSIRMRGGYRRVPKT